MCVSVVTTITICFILVIIICRSTKKSEPELAPLSPSGPGYSSNLHNVDNLKLCAMIGQGKYGTVWKGMINEQAVAVKIFPSHYKQYFTNEKDIYTSNLMKNPCLSEYYGCDTRRTMNDNIEYLLVMSLAPYGCLQDWLIENTCSFDVFTKMAKSVAHGLSYMHTDLRMDELSKPCICHRDLNSRNILVKSDMTCCITDFGFALKTFGPRYEWRGEIALAETKSINEVGTLRYMAPEVLEGAVNLRDCETALKQIDVYALGLVLWELCVRCHDWYSPGQSITPYMAPYDAEVGKNPSFEHMQVLVSRHKGRPQFPSNWGGSTASRIAKDTCEDCWDHDAEARLTAICAEERIHELSLLQHQLIQQELSPSLSKKNVVFTSTSVVTSLPRSMYQNNVTTIITPPNQITPNCNSIDAVDKVLCVTSNRLTQNIQTFQLDNPQIGNRKFDASTDDLIENSTSSVGNESNLISEIFPKIKQTDFRGWYDVRALLKKKLFKRHNQNAMQPQKEDAKPISIDQPSVIIVNNSSTSSSNTRCLEKTLKSGISEGSQRPSVLDLNCSIHTNNRPTSLISSSTSCTDDANGFKKPPGDFSNQAFAIINQSPRIVVSKSANTVKHLNSLEAIHGGDDVKLKRQRSLEVFREVFGAKGSIERLRDPSQRVKTPGDVPPSVRKIRASKTLSLYDDRMMDTSTSNTI